MLVTHFLRGVEYLDCEDTPAEKDIHKYVDMCKNLQIVYYHMYVHTYAIHKQVPYICRCCELCISRHDDHDDDDGQRSFCCDCVQVIGKIFGTKMYISRMYL